MVMEVNFLLANITITFKHINKNVFRKIFAVYIDPSWNTEILQKHNILIKSGKDHVKKGITKSPKMGMQT